MLEKAPQPVVKKPQSTKVLLVLGFASVIIILLIISVAGLQYISLLSNKLSSTINENNIRSQYANDMRHSSRSRTMILHQMARTPDPFDRDELLLQLREKGEAFLKARDVILNLGLDDESMALLNKQREFSTLAGPLQYDVIDLLNQGQTEEAIAMLVEQVIPVQDQAIGMIDQFIQLQQQRNMQSLKKTNDDFDRSYQVIIVLTVIGVGIGLLVSFIVFRSTNKILQALYNSELREKVIRENIVDVVITFDQDGVIESCNKAIQNVFGYMPEEVVGEKLNMLMSFNDITHRRLDMQASQ